MNKNHRLFILGAGVLTLALIGLISVISSARADIAPPESPPGAVIVPGAETTQVRMMSEEVIFTLISSGDLAGQAKTDANFLMRNLGTTGENMDVRFPLVYGEALSYTEQFHEIEDFKVQVDGKPVTTTRITTTKSGSSRQIPWDSFPVRFPAGVDVKISVSYTTVGFGYDSDPFRQYRYILETGAGWNATIGAGDLIVRLPYPANEQNTGISVGYGTSKITGGPVFSGNEARWHFENLEPTSADNFDVSLVPLTTWKSILDERQNTQANPKDGEAWGRLGKAIKAAITYPKGYLREDEGGKKLFAEAVEAYDKAVTLLPKDALWHFGYADLLWSHYAYPSQGEHQDISELTRIAEELRLSQQIDPTIQRARDLLDWASEMMPWAIAKQGEKYNFLILTTTPTEEPATATPEEPAALITPTPDAATFVPSEQTITSKTVEPTTTIIPATSMPTAKNPICGSAMALPLLVGLVWFLARRRY